MNKTSSKQLREIITSLRDECIDLLPEEFHDRVADASKAYFEHRKNLNAELQRLKDVERRASNLDKELTDRQKQCDEQQQLIHALQRKSASAEKALADSVGEQEQSLASLESLKGCIHTVSLEITMAQLRLIGMLCAPVDVHGRQPFECEITRAASNHIADDPVLDEKLSELILVCIGGYILQWGATHLVKCDELVVAVEQDELLGDFDVTVMTHDEATEFYDLKE